MEPGATDRVARQSSRARVRPGLFALYWLLLPATIFAACTAGNIPTGTRITPEFFQYATIIQPPADGSPGGWRAVCIMARVGQRIAHPQGAHIETGRQCGLEFGTPIVNKQHGYIPLPMAQRTSADVANDVAYKVLRRERGVTASTCLKLKTGMNVGLDTAINGSRVTQCGVTSSSHLIPVVHWPAVAP